MAQRLRIFISSPGDVPNERLRAELIIDKLAQDFSRYFSLESYRWEHEPMLASGHFQDAIEPPSAADIVVLILWSRLGTPLPERTSTREYRGLDGRVPVTGTEWEYEEALAAARQRGAPDILVFRNVSPATVDARDPDARARSLQQLDALDAFWKRYFADRGVFLAGACEYQDIEDFARRLEESLRKLIERRLKSRAGSISADATPTWLGNPFRGLQSYEFEHAAVFFGRDALVAKAAEHLSSRARAGRAFLLLVGASGSGKSSLVKAALVPRLMKPQRIEGTAMLRRLVFRPGEAQADLVLGFAEALTRAPATACVGLPELLAPGQTPKDLADLLRASAAAPAFLFGNAMGRVTEAARASKSILPHENAKIIIVIDQLEELFTASQIGPDERRAFVQLLNGLSASGVAWLIGTIRADFWHHVLEIPELLTLAEGDGRLDIAAPSPAEVAEIIRKPAQVAGLTFETHAQTGLGLDTVLAEHASSEPGVLPLLSFTLDVLYREDVERRGGHELTFAQYEQLGGLEGAIAKRADEVLDSLPTQAQAAAPRVLRALATLGGMGNQAPVARSVPLQSFPPGSDGRAVVDAFVAARLLVASTEGEIASVRIAHESLINRWERARQQLTADRRDLETRAFIEQQYARWQQAPQGAREQLLLRDPDLANALDLERRWGDELGSHIRDFIALSHRRQRRRHRFAVAASIVFGIVALAATVFGVLAHQAQQQAEAARARAMTAEATAVTERDQAVQQRNAALISQSRYLAAEADGLVKDGQIHNAIALLRIALPDPAAARDRPLVTDAIAAAYRALYANREKARVSLPAEATAVSTVPGKQDLVIATPDRLVLRTGWESEGERILPHDFGRVARLVLSDERRRVVLIAPNGALSVRDLGDNRELMKHAGDGPGTQAFLLANGERLLIVSSDNKTWRVLDVETGREITRRELGGRDPIVSLVDVNREVLVALGGGRLRSLSPNDLSDLHVADVDAAAEYALTLSPDRKLVYVAAARDILGGRVLVLDAATLELRRTFGKVVGGARHIAMSPNSKWLAVHGAIGIDFFDASDGERLYHIVASRDGGRGRFVGQSGDYIAYGGNGFIRRYAAELGIEMAAYRMPQGGSVEQIVEVSDRSGFIAISDRPSATVWSYDAQIISRQYTVPLVLHGVEMNMPAMIGAFADSVVRDEVLASYIDGGARRWDLQTGGMRVVREPAAKAARAELVTSLPGGRSVFAEPSGRLLIYTDASGASAPAGEMALEPLAYLGELGNDLAFSATKSGRAYTLDVSSPTQPKSQLLPELGRCLRQVSLPGYVLCVDDNSTIRVWDAHAHRVAFEQPAPEPATLSSGFISEDGSILATGYSNGEISVHSVKDGALLARQTLRIELSGNDLKEIEQSGLLSDADRAKVRQGAQSLELALGPTSMAVSRDGRWLALAMLDRSIRLIDLTSGEARDPIRLNRRRPQELAFSPNGAFLGAIEAGEYRALGVYQVPGGENVMSVSLGAQSAPKLHPLHNGKGFATIDAGGRILVHPFFQDWRDLVGYLAAEFPEQLTARQRRAFFIE